METKLITENLKEYYYTTLGPDIINRILEIYIINVFILLINLVLQLHIAHTVITISSITLLLIRLNKQLVNILNSLIHLMVFSTFILALAIVRDSSLLFTKFTSTEE